MQFSDPRKTKIFIEMANQFNMQEFIDTCTAQGFSVNGSELEYAQKVGMLLYSKNKYPDVSLFEAYMQFTVEANQAINSGTLLQGCATCGGGQVR